MIETEQYRPLAEYLHKVSTEFLNSFTWVKELTPDQFAVHKISQQTNVDCHNGYMSNIYRNMAKAKPFRLQHKAYFYIQPDICNDSTNRMKTEDVPVGVILKRITSAPCNEDNYRPTGRLYNEVRGTLYYRNPNKAKMVSICKVSNDTYPFYHPYYWDVPSVEHILKTFAFAEQKHINNLLAIINGTVMSEPEPVVEPKKPVKKKAPQRSLVQANNLTESLRKIQRTDQHIGSKPLMEYFETYDSGDIVWSDELVLEGMFNSGGKA